MIGQVSQLLGTAAPATAQFAQHVDDLVGRGRRLQPRHQFALRPGWLIIRETAAQPRHLVRATRQASRARAGPPAVGCRQVPPTDSLRDVADPPYLGSGARARRSARSTNTS